jgi:GT2 family glycosyltransferase
MSEMTAGPIRYSIVILTYARDAVLAEVIDRLAPALAGRTDCEVILVDNNPDAGDRAGIGGAAPIAASSPATTVSTPRGARSPSCSMTTC